MAKGDIRLHKEHGLNPTLCVCFFCGKDTGAIALLGSSYKGEAPHRTIVNYEPCDACKKFMNEGVTLIEAEDKPIDNRPKIFDMGYPTGRWLTIKSHDLIRQLFDETTAESVIEHRHSLIDPPAYDKILEMLTPSQPDTTSSS